MPCEDFPCCGHENGCCPDFDESGKQMNMVCTCGTKLPVNNRSSLCNSCLLSDDGDRMTDAEADADTLASAGWGTNEDYGDFGGDFYDE